MEITTLTIDDAIRERTANALHAGEDLTELTLDWTPEEWAVLEQFTGPQTGRVYYLGVYHTLKD
jgi:hypothetical protein